MRGEKRVEEGRRFEERRECGKFYHCRAVVWQAEFRAQLDFCGNGFQRRILGRLYTIFARKDS